jgi:hypothetical protein
MPSKSKAQHNFMEAVAHNPAFAKKAGVPQSVGQDFSKADKGKTFKQGGDMKKMNMGGYAGGGKMAKGGMAKKMAGGGMTSMGKVATAAPSRDGMATKGKTKGTMISMSGNKGMKKGGMAKC